MTAVRTVLWVAVLVFAGALGWASYEWYRSDAGGGGKPYGVPFQLTDQNGQPITEAAFRGRPTAVFFGFTHCPEVCPTTLYELNGWLEKVDPAGDRIGAYFITVDPERDTPQMMKDYIASVSSRIIGISGEPEKIDEVIRGFNVYAKKVPNDPNDPADYTMDHTASVFLLDAAGRFKSTIAYQENPDIAIRKLENLLKG
jgi:Uncharacterized protein SCO1/SenC/PrrC, involved in biogenesis of respiratory and photosynthetic systems